MTKINENYLNLQGSYLFAEVAKRTAAYKAANPTQEVISLGIGDVSQPLVPAVVDAMKKACDEMGQAGTFRGYGPYEGYDFLRKAIAKYDYQARGINIAEDEIFVSDGAKSDVANFQELFSVRSRVALQDPVYPVYLDTNVMAGRSGRFENGQFKNIIYLPCTAENNFSPSISYVTRQDEFDCGIMITASHNPFTDNGIKVINRHGEKLDDDTTALIEAYIDGDLTALGIV